MEKAFLKKSLKHHFQKWAYSLDSINKSYFVLGKIGCFELLDANTAEKHLVHVGYNFDFEIEGLKEFKLVEENDFKKRNSFFKEEVYCINGNYFLKEDLNLKVFGKKIAIANMKRFIKD